MTLEELKEALEEMMPGASFTTSPKGEVIIHSNLTEDEDSGELVDMDETDDDFDFDQDRDTESYNEIDMDDEE